MPGWGDGVTDARLITFTSNGVRDYERFVAAKLAFESGVGITSDIACVELFDHQRALVRWALSRGRAAIFADTGLGKTRMELAWANAINKQTLILAPLAVAPQIQEEGARIGIHVNICRDDSDVRAGINVTNYDRLHRFDPQRFQSVVLDESSIIKHHDAKTFGTLTDAFRRTRYRLCATATPAPNDFTELGTHAEFLGIRTRTEMLSEFFVHDGGDTKTWRLKGHARTEFWRWVASWGAMIRMPSDLGFDDARYRLPTLNVQHHSVRSAPGDIGQLFITPAQTLSERRAARRASLAERVAQCAAIVNADAQPWVVWCDLNDESDALVRSIPGAVEIRGADSIDDKESRLAAFARGESRVLVSKPSICGWGLNWQHCARMAFVGLTDSYEAYYQAVRRCWRFGQTRPVDVHVFASEMEGSVVANIARKEREANTMAEALRMEVGDAVQASVNGFVRETNSYNAATRIHVPHFLKTGT